LTLDSFVQTARLESGKHLVLWDGECRFCGRAVDWIQARDRRQQFQPVRYQEAPTPPMTPELYEACAGAMHVIDTSDRVYRGGRAFLFILERLGWGPVARLLAVPPLIWIVELGYRIVADNRMLFSRMLFRARQGSRE
jgi:predicted DCC family thiol-disulfide oxidoreductase YuxK